jgi:hypothetical protein
MQKFWKEGKYDHGSRWDQKTKLTVLARTISNLPDRQT